MGESQPTQEGHQRIVNLGYFRWECLIVAGTFCAHAALPRTAPIPSLTIAGLIAATGVGSLIYERIRNQLGPDWQRIEFPN